MRNEMGARWKGAWEVWSISPLEHVLSFDNEAKAVAHAKKLWLQSL